ncbi:MAG: GTP 3',8-cyclase MoaA [Candidatus Latescibacterota bacterium]
MKMTDSFGRTISYLRISVTDRCNLRCRYCMPSDGISLLGHDEVLKYEEIVRLVRIAADLGFDKFRLTGGEPLVRRGVVGLVETLCRQSLKERSMSLCPSKTTNGKIRLAMTTNGVLLTEHAGALRKAGLDRINVSLDTLDRATFRRITGFDGLERVMSGILEAKSVGFEPPKINVVAMRGINDNEFGDFIQLAKDGFEVRFIELMPFRMESGNGSDRYISGSEIREKIARRYQLRRMEEGPATGPARMYQVEDWPGRVGFIEPISSRYCTACNRLRLTADGFLKSCLLSDDEVDLKTPLRTGATDEEIAELFAQAVREKPGGHRLRERKIPMRTMAQVGG